MRGLSVSVVGTKILVLWSFFAKCSAVEDTTQWMTTNTLSEPVTNEYSTTPYTTVDPGDTAPNDHKPSPEGRDSGRHSIGRLFSTSTETPSLTTDLQELYKLFLYKMTNPVSDRKTSVAVTRHSSPLFKQGLAKKIGSVLNWNSKDLSISTSQNKTSAQFVNRGQGGSKGNKTASAHTKPEDQTEANDQLRLNREELERLLSSLLVGFLDVLNLPVSELRNIDLKDLIHKTITSTISQHLFPRLKPDYRRLLNRLLEMGDDSALPLTSIQYLQELGGNSTACLQRLMCRASPFVWGLQQSLAKSNRLITRDDNRCQGPRSGWWPVYLPTKHAFSDFSQNCDDRFPQCP